MGSLTPQGRDALALSHAACCLPLRLTPSAPRMIGPFSRAQYPAYIYPCQRFDDALRPPPHDSGPGWFATPFLYDSFIHDSTPVYPDAEGGTRTPTSCLTRPSNVRVCQFRHFGMK